MGRGSADRWRIDIEILEQKRQKQDMDAIYILAPLPYIVDCIMADFERRRYKGVRLLWTSSMLFRLSKGTSTHTDGCNSQFYHRA